jgi:hypothetical protein
MEGSVAVRVDAYGLDVQYNQTEHHRKNHAAAKRAQLTSIALKVRICHPAPEFISSACQSSRKSREPSVSFSSFTRASGNPVNRSPVVNLQLGNGRTSQIGVCINLDLNESTRNLGVS